METMSTFAANEIKSIQINSKLSQVNVVVSNSKDIILRWTNTKRRNTTARQAGKALVVEDDAPIKFYGVMGLIWLKQDKELTLELPCGYDGMIQIESRDEFVNVLGIEILGSLHVKTTTGAIEISAAKAHSFQLNSMAGNINIRGIVSGNGISATSTSGNIDCFCAESPQSYLMDCLSEHGVCNLPPAICQGSKPLRLRTTTGGIAVQFLNEERRQNADSIL